MPRTKKIKQRLKLPNIIKSTEKRDIGDFPLRHYSYSSFVKFSTNPLMFKVNYINGDRLDTCDNISRVIGQSFHNAMEVYYSMNQTDEQEAMKMAMESGINYLNEYNDGLIEFSSRCETKQKACEIYIEAFKNYIKEKQSEDVEILGIEECLEGEVCVEWRGEIIELPVPLKGYVDKIIRTKDGKIKVVDYKTAQRLSDPNKIDGAKILQAIQYYFLVYSEYEEAPYSMIFEEVKLSKNRDGSPQIREYEIVYEDNDLFFDFYFRMYQDVTDAINGKSVFVPNINDFYDNEVGIIAYIHRLDIPEEQAKLMEKLKVDNITDLLKKNIQHAGNMRKLLKSAEEKFTTAKSLNYKNMTIEEKISTKLIESGIIIKYDSKIEGLSVDLYQYEPTVGVRMKKIESYVADIEQVVGVSGVRILAPIPNSEFVGFEIPKSERIFPEIEPQNNGFNLAMGVDIYGELIRFDIRNAPHMLVAGATGSGKSVFLNSIITQLQQLENIDLHLFDPKMVELSPFRKNAKEYHDDIESIYLALSELVSEMNRRYKTFSEAGARNIEEYDGDLNYKVVVIDEFGDLIVSNHTLEEDIIIGHYANGMPKTKKQKTNLSKEIQSMILILAQKARAAGIHIIIATQRPSVDIITGSIKANFPTKVAFRTAKEIDSRVLLDEPGAEKLLGKGDMLFSSDQGTTRLQGLKI